MVAIAALLMYSVFATRNSRLLVTEIMVSQIERQTTDYLKIVAARQAGLIQSPINQAFDAARNMARSFEVIASDRSVAAVSASRRAQVNAILLDVLTDNPTFNGTYSAWEPNALDGNDGAFRSNAGMGSDATGRMLPYWTRGAGGQIAVQPLVEFDSRELHPNGVMKGGWYIGPSGGMGESILDPLPYVVQGKSVYLATMSVPIMVEGKFQGVAGADFDLAFVQKLAKTVKAAIYDGNASVEIVSNKGLVVASSDRQELIGRPFDQGNPALASKRCPGATFAGAV